MRPLTEGPRKILLELALAAVVNGLFLALSALLLWPAGKAILSAHLARGFCLFAVAVCGAASAGIVIQRALRIESDPPSNAYVMMNLCVSAALQLGWSAFAALAVAGLAAGSSLGIAAALHAAGFISCLLSTMVTGALYQGTLYKRVNAVLALAGYVVFAIWPGVGRAVFGWAFV